MALETGPKSPFLSLFRLLRCYEECVASVGDAPASASASVAAALVA